MTSRITAPIVAMTMAPMSPPPVVLASLSGLRCDSDGLGTAGEKE